MRQKERYKDILGTTVGNSYIHDMIEFEDQWEDEEGTLGVAECKLCGKVRHVHLNKVANRLRWEISCDCELANYEFYRRYIECEVANDKIVDFSYHREGNSFIREYTMQCKLCGDIRITCNASAVVRAIKKPGSELAV